MRVQRLISAPLQAFEERGEVLHYRVQGHPPGSNESLLGGLGGSVSWILLWNLGAGIQARSYQLQGVMASKSSLVSL